MATSPLDPNDWPSQVTDRIVGLVDQVRSKTTDQAITIARALVFGTVVVLLAIVVVVLGLVGVFRLLDVYLPFETWATYLLLGAILTAVGAVLWSQRRPRSA